MFGTKKKVSTENNMGFAFKREFTLVDRKATSERIITKYGDRLPIIVEKAPGNNEAPAIDKTKFLVPDDITVGKFVYEIRKQMTISSDKAIFIFVGNGILPPTVALMRYIYEKYRDEDGFLYISYSGENVFG